MLLKEQSDYQFYSIECREEDRQECKEEDRQGFYIYKIAYLVINNQNEVRIINISIVENKHKIVVERSYNSFFYCDRIYCLEFTLSNNIKSRCLFYLEKNNIVLDKKDIYENVFILDINKDFDNFFTKFHFEKCSKPKLLRKIVYAWSLYDGGEKICLLTTTDGMVKMFKTNFIKRESSKLYKVQSKYKNSFLQYEIILKENKEPHINDKRFIINDTSWRMEPDSSEKGYVEYKIYDVFYYNKNNLIMQFLIKNNNLEIKDEMFIGYTGDYWIESSKNNFRTPFKVNGFRIVLKDQLYECDIDPIESSVNDLLEDFERSEHPKIIWKPEEMYYSYCIYYKNQFIEYLYQYKDEIRIDHEIKDDTIFNNNITYIVKYSTKNRKESLANILEAKFGVLYGKLVLLTQGFSAKIYQMMVDSKFFNSLKPAELVFDL